MRELGFPFPLFLHKPDTPVTSTDCGLAVDLPAGRQLSSQLFTQCMLLALLANGRLALSGFISRTPSAFDTAIGAATVNGDWIQSAMSRSRPLSSLPLPLMSEWSHDEMRIP